MRLFIAINFSKRTKKLINNKVDILKKEINQDLKWIKKDNWHITLRFIGETDTSNLSKIKNTLANIKSINKFYIQLNVIGAFPNYEYPRVLYLGINQGNDKLIKIHKEIEKKLVSYGFEKNKKNYTPHLTIARTNKNNSKSKLSKILKKFIKKKYFINIYELVDKVSLIKSELYPSGPKYYELFSIYLK